MKKRPGRFAALVTACIIPFTAAGASQYETYLTDGTAPSLREIYGAAMDIGIPETAVLGKNPASAEMAAEQCSMLICEETMCCKKLLDRGSSKKRKDEEHARLTIGKASEALDFAAGNGMKVRAATIVQAESVPIWFFNEGWADSSRAQRTDGQTAARRMENAIRDQIGQINGKYPGLVTAWEVIRGGQDPESNLFRQVIGEGYTFLAFRAARESAAEDQKLLWALTDEPDEEMFRLLTELHEQGLLDGIVLECSMTMDEAELQRIETILTTAGEAGIEVHLSGLEIANTDRTA